MMGNIGSAMEMARTISEIKGQAEQAEQTHPAGFALAGLASLLLRELIRYALRMGPSPRLAQRLGVDEKMAQTIREAVLTEELARHGG